MVSIQSLRGVAATMVVVLHVSASTKPFGWDDLTPLSAGVDLFFVISGFIMWVTTAAKPGITALRFYKDRIIRIVPLYWFLTMIALAFVTATPPHIAASLVFLPYPNKAGFSPVLIPGWTLLYEMFFYLLFGAAVWISPGRLVQRAALILSFLAALVIVGRLLKPDGVFGFYTDAIIAEFAFGISLGILFRLKPSAIHPLWTLGAALGVGMISLSFVTNMGPRIIASGVPATLIVAGAVFGFWPRLKLLEAVGNWSYSLYLSHWIVIIAIPTIPEVPGPGWVKALFVLTTCLLTSAFSYRFFEVPVTRWLKGWNKAASQV
jgi:exopolysaccharide production protein ExoZ